METIYAKLGDKELQKLIDEFYNRVFESPVIGGLFANSIKEEVKDKQFSFLTQFLGGPPRYIEKYGNPMMRRRHLPHRITNEAKEEWLKLMHEAIQTLSIDDDLKNALYQCFPKLAEHMVNS